MAHWLKELLSFRPELPKITPVSSVVSPEWDVVFTKQGFMGNQYVAFTITQRATTAAKAKEVVTKRHDVWDRLVEVYGKNYQGNVNAIIRVEKVL